MSRRSRSGEASRWAGHGPGWAAVSGDHDGAQLPDTVEEAEHAFGEQHGGGLVVRRQAVAGEQVLAAAVKAQLRVRGRLDERTGCVEVALPCEELAGVHAVDLDRDSFGPCTAEFRDWDTGMEQQRTLRAGSRLGQHLRRKDAEREPGADEFAGQPLGGSAPALDDRIEPGLVGIADALLKGPEDPSFEQVRLRGAHGRAAMTPAMKTALAPFVRMRWLPGAAAVSTSTDSAGGESLAERLPRVGDAPWVRGQPPVPGPGQVAASSTRKPTFKVTWK